VDLLHNLRLLATYNEWMNSRLYTVASELSVAILKENKHAFFGSIQNTLNHLLVGDILWLKRFAQHPAQFSALDFIRQLPPPTALDQLLYEDFAAQFEQRKIIDAVIIKWLAQLTATDIDTDLTYQNSKGLTFTRNLGSLLTHFFNHQTHHRGQTTTLLSQCGIDVGMTDFLAVIPNAVEK
jgi:uncharacterized damage-inducible protein DinB